MSNTKNTLFPKLGAVITAFDYQTIPAERKEVLQALVDYIQDKVN